MNDDFSIYDYTGSDFDVEYLTPAPAVGRAVEARRPHPELAAALTEGDAGVLFRSRLRTPAEREAARLREEERMRATIPETYLDLFEKPALAYLGTLMANGSPQVTPVWVDYDGKHIRVNSAKGRLKDKNMRRDPRVSLAVQDPGDPYRYVEIRGRVVEITQEGADEHIDKLAQKYLGKPVYPFRRPDELRIMYTIEPEKVSGMG